MIDDDVIKLAEEKIFNVLKMVEIYSGSKIGDVDFTVYPYVDINDRILKNVNIRLLAETIDYV